MFENDVKAEGTKLDAGVFDMDKLFENDVKAEDTKPAGVQHVNRSGLRMM